jgi:diaminohydroxyphosphoribosylaminopyrimidine deaminase/5-amino-6-(5-phosphoribosylamino)uracil reductase
MASSLVDEIWLLRGPDPIGANGLAALEAMPLEAITQSPNYRVRGSETLGKDTLTIYERA